MNEKIFKILLFLLGSIASLFSAANILLAWLFTIVSVFYIKERGADYYSVSVIVFFTCLSIGEFLSIFALRKGKDFVRGTRHILLSFFRVIWILFLSLLLWTLMDENVPKKDLASFATLACIALAYNTILFLFHLSFSFKRVREKFVQAEKFFEKPPAQTPA